jgi:hypothetical protein
MGSFDSVNLWNNMNQATRQAGEDITNDVQKVETRWQSANMTTATTTTHATGAGVCGGIEVGKQVAAGTITVYDNTAASGTILGKITFGAAILTDPPLPTFLSGVKFNIGLTVITSAATDLAVKWAIGAR